MTVDPAANFAAHMVEGGVEIDRMKNGQVAVLENPGWFHVPNQPTYVLRAEGETRAALGMFGRSRVVIRQEPSTIAPRTGEAIATWDAGAIRLALHPANAPVLQSDVFNREGGGGGPALLSREGSSLADRDGTYRATLRDAAGQPLGWLRVRLEPGEELGRVYEGQIPSTVDDALAAAAVLVLDGEVSWLSKKQ
jgi:hypothetical protein